MSLQGISQAQPTLNAIGPAQLDETNYVAPLLDANSNNAATPLRPSMLAKVSGAVFNMPNQSHGNVAICADAMEGGGGGRSCGSAGSGDYGDTTLTRIFFGPNSKPIPGLRVVNKKLTGQISVFFRNSDGGDLSQATRSNMVRKLKLINQTASNGYGISLNFVEGNARTSKGPYIVVDIDSNAATTCGENALGCYIDDLGSKSASRRLVIPPWAADSTVVHEFGHYLGFSGHSSVEGTLMYSVAPRGLAVPRLQDQEVENIVREYKKLQ
jgi:hypothetical protein